MKRRYLFILFILVLLILGACQVGSDDPTPADPDPTATAGGGVTVAPPSGSDISTGTNAEGWIDGSPAEADRSFAKVSEEPAEGAPLLAADVDYEAVVVEAEESLASAPTSGRAADMDAASRLTAGEVDDNARWDDYLLFLRDYRGQQIIPVDVGERHQVWVRDSDGRPVLGALVEISAAGQEVTRLRTHSDGRVYFFPGAFGDAGQVETYDVRVSVGDQSVELAIPAGGSQREWEVVLPAAGREQGAVRLDVLFLLDATGSMGDEIAQLKDNIQAISAAIDSLPSRPDVRLAMTVYRDQGDAFVSRTFDFTPDVSAFEAALAEVQAAGGGDYPEDLNEALSRAIHTPEWRVEETVSLIFLVADAPPHLDYGQENHYAAEVLEAAGRGIKIYPIASSGLDEQGEYIYRQLAQISGGRFIFLTYGPEGPGTTGEETTMNVDQYTVSSLDDLVVSIVEEELAHQTQ